MRISCRSVVAGKWEGEALVTTQPLNFLAMLDLKNGIITDSNHELYGRNITDKVLVFPNAVGSSVGAYSIYALKMNNASPRAMICSRADITTASGCAIAEIPLVEGSDEIFKIRSGSVVRFDAGKGFIEA